MGERVKNQAELIFLSNLEVMKEVLDLGEYKMGKDSKEYTYFKRRVMDTFYVRLKELLKGLADEKLIVKCSCNANLRQGYTKCPHCHGAGYVNLEPDSEKVKMIKSNTYGGDI